VGYKKKLGLVQAVTMSYFNNSKLLHNAKRELVFPKAAMPRDSLIDSYLLTSDNEA
jgi:hypothetical protein